MKKFIFFLFVLLAMTSKLCYADNPKEFLKELRKKADNCAIDYDKYAEGDDTVTQHVLQMTELEYNRIECYLSVGDLLINKFFSKESDKFKSDWKNYVQSTLNIQFSLKNSLDYCIPKCGLISQLDGASTAAEEIEKTLYYFIEYLENNKELNTK